MNLQDRFYGSQIRGVGKKFITAVSDENLLEAKEAVETGLFGKAGEVLSEEASLQTIADRIISGDVAERLEESSKKPSKKESSDDDEEDNEEDMEEALGAAAASGRSGKGPTVGGGNGKSAPSMTAADKRAISTVGDKVGGKVKNGLSMAGLEAAWGSNDPDYDLNGDGTVDGTDLGLFLAMMGESTETVSENAAMDPMQMMQMLMSMMMMGKGQMKPQNSAQNRAVAQGRGAATVDGMPYNNNARTMGGQQ